MKNNRADPHDQISLSTAHNISASGGGVLERKLNNRRPSVKTPTEMSKRLTVVR